MANAHDARVRKANDAPVQSGGRFVLYWCQMFRRLTHNHALDYAIALATTLKKPLVIYEGLKLNYPWANARFHTFMLEGMHDNFAAAKKLGVSYWPFVETPGNSGRGLVRKLAKDACVLVTDDYPAFIIPAQIRAVAARIDVAVHAVDSNSVVPLSLLGATVSAAAHLRPRLHKLFPEAWPHRANAAPEVAKISRTIIDPPFELWKAPSDITAFATSLPIDQSVPPVSGITGGSVAARKQLQAFIRHKLNNYAEGRNQPDDPAINAASGISPWLHYGHISTEEVIDEALNFAGEWSLDDINRSTRNKDDYFCRDANVNNFLDEAITWRDVGYHWHFRRNADRGAWNAESMNVSWQAGSESAFNFDAMDFSPRSRGTLEATLPEWAWKSLSAHEADRREHHYTLEELESAATHDELWNAAQTELIATGRIHNYLRMLWGKKVLEWSATPEEAYRTLEHLNNKYALDGRDPNSYTGILWCFGLFDRPWPPERQVFGNIRYMSSQNTAKKFKLQGYYEYIRKLPKAAISTPKGQLF